MTRVANNKLQRNRTMSHTLTDVGKCTRKSLIYNCTDNSSTS